MNNRKVLSGVAALFLAVSAAVAGGKPVFNEDGSISYGEKNVKITSSGLLKIKIEGSVIDGSQQFYLNDKWTWVPNCENTTVKVDKEKKTTTFSGKIANSKKEISGRVYTLEMKLLEDGKINVKAFFTDDVTPKEKALKFKDMGFYLSIDYPFAAEKRLLVDGQTTKTTDRDDIKMTKTYIDYVGNTEDIENIIFSPDSPEYRVAFYFDTFEYFYCRLYKSRKSNAAANLKMRVSSDENTIEFKVDICGK